ncbi:hypothetical protein SADUNF_Sadunf02G0199400 [Salix dunnii]|uniref:Glycine-rich protein n=1 Tax=Salix dunnii TaxID=1413687 RepID=A0A835N905_9ROSI|nr:hypothetical protein SADUNF_Sadunf02G0199400 [Salix dunnii]
MARFYCLLVLIALVIARANARDVPKDTGLNDQKNFIAYGGVGGFAGVGGLPNLGGVVGGLGGIGGVGGLGGDSGSGGDLGGGVLVGVLVEVVVEIVLMVVLALSSTLDFAPHWLFVDVVLFHPVPVIFQCFRIALVICQQVLHLMNL